jgi:hypothetical protein
MYRIWNDYPECNELRSEEGESWSAVPESLYQLSSHSFYQEKQGAMMQKVDVGHAKAKMDNLYERVT